MLFLPYIKSQTCTAPVPDSDLFPRAIGGNLGDTEILCFDLVITGSKGRMAIGGRSLSQDVVTH